MQSGDRRQEREVRSQEFSIAIGIGVQGSRFRKRRET
jgi:hypothetical protein